MRQTSERGVILLEVLIALAVLAIGGVAAVAVLTESTRTTQSLQEREATSADAEEVLVNLTLLDRRGLDLRLGRRSVGAFVTDVSRPRPGVYRLAVADSTAPDVPVLVTIVARGEAP